jgi:hypothetical protein
VTGQTQAAGWQVGVRRTLPLELAEAWELLTSPPWLDRWSGLAALDRDDPAVRALTAPRVVRVRTRHSLGGWCSTDVCGAGMADSGAVSRVCGGS